MTISINDVSYRIGERELFSHLTFHCEPGKMIALAGPSGSGKTTLLSIAGLLLPPTSGSVSLGHLQRWSRHNRRAFWKDQAAFIYQDYGIIEQEKVIYNVTFHHHLHATDAQRLTDVLVSVGLQGKENEHAISLSGGEKQRVGIARALWKKARYIFADEPTASLDTGNREIVTSLLRKAADDGACILVSTHDENLIAACDQVVRLE